MEKKSVRVEFSPKIKRLLNKRAIKLGSTLKNFIEHQAEIEVNPKHKLKIK